MNFSNARVAMALGFETIVTFCVRNDDWHYVLCAGI